MKKLPNAKIVSLVEYSFTQAEIRQLPLEYSALLSLLCHAINEINLFSMLFLSTSDEPKDRHVKRKWKIQRNSLLRTLNAKVFESLKGITDYRRRLEKNAHTDRKLLSNILDEHLAKLQDLRNLRGYDTASFIRDKTTNHFLPSMAEKFLPFMSNSASRSMYLHNLNGDSFYPIGEEGIFDSAWHYRSQETGVPAEQLFKEWHEWLGEANTAVIDTFNSIGIHLITAQFPEKYGKEKKSYVEPRFLGGFNERPMPLFHLEKSINPEY